MRIAVQPRAQTAGAAIQEVVYRWDQDTEILSARLCPGIDSRGLSGSVGLEGRDGSWLILDVEAGLISGVEIAVWPDVRNVSTLAPPSHVEDAQVVVPALQSAWDVTSLDAGTQMLADADVAARTFHFTLGAQKSTRTIRLARDLLLDVDEKSQISGLWLLNVPPCPADS